MAALTLTAGIKSLLGQWGSINAAASQRLGVSGAWSAVKEGMGLTPTQTAVGVATIADMNAVYGLAAGNRNAMETLGAAADSASITAEMVGLTPNARSLSARNAAPAHNVRIAFTHTVTGTMQTDWATIQLAGSLDSYTKGSLLDYLSTVAGTLVTAYGWTTVTMTTVSINAF